MGRGNDYRRSPSAYHQGGNCLAKLLGPAKRQPSTSQVPAKHQLIISQSSVKHQRQPSTSTASVVYDTTPFLCRAFAQLLMLTTDAFTGGEKAEVHQGGVGFQVQRRFYLEDGGGKGEVPQESHQLRHEEDEAAETA